jgi:hypothetical protein
MEIDVVSDTDTVIGAVMMAVNPLIGLAIMAASLFGNHDIQPTIDHVRNNPDLNKLQLTDEKIAQLEYELETIARESKNDNPIDTFTFDTSTQALDPWQDNDIVELNDQGKWVVNAPTIAFNDIGDLFDANKHSCILCNTLSVIILYALRIIKSPDWVIVKPVSLRIIILNLLTPLNQQYLIATIALFEIPTIHILLNSQESILSVYCAIL